MFRNDRKLINKIYFYFYFCIIYITNDKNKTFVRKNINLSVEKYLFFFNNIVVFYCTYIIFKLNLIIM